MRSLLNYLCVLSLAMLVAAATKVNGQPIKMVVPNVLEETEGNTNIDGPTGGGFRVQLLFPASEFASLPDTHRLIVGYTYRPDASVTGPRTTNYGPNTEQRMSTTTKTPEELSLTFADNIGPDETLVWQGEYSVSTVNTGPTGGPKDFDYFFELQTPFFYDPSKGNLLLDFIAPSGWLNQSPNFDAHDNVYGTSIIFGPPDSLSATTRAGNPVAEFVFVPEPSSLTLLSFAFVGLLGFRKQRIATRHCKTPRHWKTQNQ